MNEQEKIRLLELFSDKVIFGLDDAELAELAELEKNFPDLRDDAAKPAHSLEFSATAIGLANLDTSEPLPANLRAKILADSDKFFASSEEIVPKTEPQAIEEDDFQPTFGFEPRRSILSWLGWAVAAAACIALAVNIWTTRFQKTEIVEKPEIIQTPTPEPSEVQKRELLLASANKIQLPLAQPKPDVTAITGDVVWDNAKQEGYVRFKGLPVNDVSKETYQLWIGDENQKNPIDGGVFNVNQNGEIIIPIKAKLKVVKPTLFAITKEKPGGVVVSELGEKLMALAKV
ncbi:hypothetical protein BH10ACI1_BH10ACI1_09730 [soil metagenome]